MKILCGTDIIEIERIKKAILEHGENFLEEIYTKKEIEYCNSKNNAKYQHFAARFAAKEAIFKAISSLVENKYKLSWKNAEKINYKNGKPNIKLIGINIENSSIDISISHCKEYAVAMCTLIKTN